MKVWSRVGVAVAGCLMAAAVGGSVSATPISYRDSVRPWIDEGEGLYPNLPVVYPFDPLIACANAGLPAARALRTCMPEWGGSREPWRIGWLLRAMDRRGSPWIRSDSPRPRRPAPDSPALPITPEEPSPSESIEDMNPDLISIAFDSDSSELSPPAVPEPGTVALVVTGLASLGRIMRKRRAEITSGRCHEP